jgi:hypothetical protein
MGISRLLKEKGREQFWPKKGNLYLTLQGKIRKTDRISILLGSIKCFSISLNTLKDTLDGSLMELVS